MPNTQNTNHFDQLLTTANTSNDQTATLLIQDMTSYSNSLESSINAEAETFTFLTTKVMEFKNRIDQLDSVIIEELGVLLYDFLAYIITYEKLLFYMVESFQRSDSLQSPAVDDVVMNIRKKGKSKIPPAASLPSRPRPVEVELSQIVESLNQLSNEIDVNLFNFLSSFVALLEILEQLIPFLKENEEAINLENDPSLNQLTNDMVVYELSLIPQIAELQAPTIFNTLQSPQLASSLIDLQNEIDDSLFAEFQSFLNYIETLENASN